MRDYMDRQVAPPKWVTSPTWGPPPLWRDLAEYVTVPSSFNIYFKPFLVFPSLQLSSPGLGSFHCSWSLRRCSNIKGDTDYCPFYECFETG